MTQFQLFGASKHKLRMSYNDCRFEAQGQLLLQNCRKAHLQSSGQSITFTNVHTVQEYLDKVYVDTRKLAEHQEYFEKRDLARSAATIAALKRRGSAQSISEETAELTTPHARRHRGSTSDSACTDDLDEAASMASPAVEKDVDMKYLTGTSKEMLTAIIKRLDTTSMLSGTGLGRTNNGADAYMTNGKLSEFDCTRLAKHRRVVLKELVSQLAFPQSTESATRSVWLSCPDHFSCHHVPIIHILAVSRVMGGGDVHPDVVCHRSVLTLGTRALHEETTVRFCGTLKAQGVEMEPASVF